MGILAIAAMKDMLQNGRKVTKTVDKRTKKVTRTNSAGDVIYEEVTELPEHTITSHYPVPDSVMKNCAPPLNIEEAQALLEQAGYVVIDPNGAKETRERAIKLTQETYQVITKDDGKGIVSMD